MTHILPVARRVLGQLFQRGGYLVAKAQAHKDSPGDSTRAVQNRGAVRGGSGDGGGEMRAEQHERERQQHRRCYEDLQHMFCDHPLRVLHRSPPVCG